MSKRYKLLNKFCQENFQEWRELFGSNLIGVHVGKKIRKGKEINRYSIVFHLKEKNDEASTRIPDHFEFESEIGQIKIGTDVLETNDFELQSIFIGDKARHINMLNFGTLGLVLKRNENIYLCSNMHVLGEPFLQSGINSYYLDITQQTEVNVIIENETDNTYAFLEQGIFGDVDIAIARVYDPSKIDVRVAQFGFHNGIVILNYNNYQNYPVVIIGAQSGLLYTKIRRIETMITFQKYGFNTTFTNLVCTEKVAQGGDSGSLVFDYNSNKIVGIVVGSDHLFTYIIPVWRILNYFNATLV